MESVGYMKLCKTLAISLLPCLFGAGCGLDKGSSGDIPPQNVFLEAEGCVGDSPNPGQAGTILYSGSFNASANLSLLEARLEVLRGDVDVVVGTEEPPSDYFAFGRGPGTQKILVGRDSREPVGERLRPWFVQLVSPLNSRECFDGVEPDWRLSVIRSSGLRGRLLHDQEGDTPTCLPGVCVPEEVQIEVPEDALSMEISLESMKGEDTGGGDADLLVGLGNERESLVSLNRGPGYDVVVIDQERLVPLRGQSVVIRLESWQSPTNYRLRVTYTPGEPEVETPPEPPEEDPPL
jgi:hypothetical protein